MKMQGKMEFIMVRENKVNLLRLVMDFIVWTHKRTKGCKNRRTNSYHGSTRNPIKCDLPIKSKRFMLAAAVIRKSFSLHKTIVGKSREVL